MLYIFHVDTGTMMMFEMNLALESVAHLREVIERACRIPPEKQVLLVSGGESLEPAARVCSYSAGTDTNPIFLFSKCSIESVSPPSPSIDYGSDMDLKEQVDAALSMPASYNTVVERAQLAQQFCELARDQTRICERLVHDQHLQQQGWAAVVANLEDSVMAFRTRGEAFVQSYQQHLESRAEYISVLENFNEVLDTLSKIPVLPGLMANVSESTEGQDGKTKESNCNNGSSGEMQPQQTALKSCGSAMSTAAVGDETESMAVSKKSSGSRSGSGDEWQRRTEEKAMTLLQWISTKDNQSTLEQMVDLCARSLEQFDERVLELLQQDVDNALSAANKVDMKEIKGLEERLFGLEQLMFETKRVVQEQSDLATAFHQNQTRANNLGDASILPDLCASHRRQMLVMLRNHHQLRDIRRRCNRAKEELSINLYHRLRWIMYVENRMCDVASKLMIYHENLKRLRRHLEVVRQIQMAPSMYVSAVGEVVRRRTFSQAFLVWAGDLSTQLQAVHSEELARRRDFQSRFEGHFLNTLFPGMEDCPPPFATQAPSAFDTALPKLNKEDVERLKTELPNLALSLSVPDLGHLAELFFAKSVTGTLKPDEKDSVPLEDRLVEAVTAAGLGSTLDPTLLQTADNTNISPSPSSLPLKDDRGCESETDTEEFEKVGQSPVELERTAAPATTAEVGVQSASTQDVGIQCDGRRMPLQSRSSGRSGDSFSMSIEKDVCDLHRNSLVEVGLQCDGDFDASATLCDSESASEPPTPSTSSSLYPTTDSGIQCDAMVGSCLRTSSTLSHGSVDVAVQISSLVPSSFPATFSMQRLVTGGPKCEVPFSPTTVVGVQCCSPSSTSSSYIVDRSWPIRGARSLSHAGPLPHSPCADARDARNDVAVQCPSSAMSSPSQSHGHPPPPVEFISTEFYMDESMPSSFTESNSLKSHTMPEMDKQIQDSQTLVGLLQDNLGNAQLQAEQARVHLSTMGRMALAATERLHAELGQMRGQVEVERDTFVRLLGTFQSAWEQLLSAANSASSAGRALDLEVELERERRAITAKDDIIRTLTQSVEERTATVEQLEASLRQRLKTEEQQRVQTEQLQRRLEETENSAAQSDQQCCADLERRLAELEKDREQCEDLQRRLDIMSQGTMEDVKRAVDEQKASLEAAHARSLQQFQAEAEAEKTRALKDLGDKLARDHQSQLEGLRSRFRLVACTSMDKLPSDSSLEKVEVVRGQRLELESDIKEALTREIEQKLQLEWDVKLQQELRNARLKHEAERQVWFNDAMRRVLTEKDQQLEVLRAREAALTEKCQRHSETIQRLTDEDNNSGCLENRANLYSLLERNEQLVSELEVARAQLLAMGTSVAVMPPEGISSRDAATSPEPHRMKNNLTYSANSLVQQGKISIGSCVPGDAVLVVWDDIHQSYKVLQESNTLFFVHSDCLESLGLSLQSEEGKRKIYSTAEVIDKEYCHARKSENRYHVPKGTKFYRVKVKPLQDDNLMLKSTHRHKERQQQMLQQLQQEQQIQLQQPIPQQPMSLPHPDKEDLSKVKVHSAHETEAVSLPFIPFEPQSGSSANSLPDIPTTEASQ